MMPRQTSAERFKLLVQQEGKDARNLVTWSVPVTKSEVDRGNMAGARTEAKSAGRRHSNGRHRKDRRGQSSIAKATDCNHGLFTARSREMISQGKEPPFLSSVGQTSLSKQEEICMYYSKTQRQSRSSKLPSKLNLQARYWSYLFDNLHRAVDEIYRTCEADESTVECQVGKYYRAQVLRNISFFLLLNVAGGNYDT